MTITKTLFGYRTIIDTLFITAKTRLLAIHRMLTLQRIFIRQAA